MAVDEQPTADAPTVPPDMVGDDTLSEADSDDAGDDEQPDDDVMPQEADLASDEEDEDEKLQRLIDQHFPAQDSEDTSDDDSDEEDDVDEEDGAPEDAQGDDAPAATGASEEEDEGKPPKLASADLPRQKWPRAGTVYVELDVETSGGKKNTRTASSRSHQWWLMQVGRRLAHHSTS